MSSYMLIESFKLILLPIWVGSYRYQDEDYKVVVNGQTGTVRGVRPRGGLRKLLDDILGDGRVLTLRMPQATSTN